MSHASLLVALPSHEHTEEALADAMAPFRENDWGRLEFPRWDDYEIGGRYGGKLGGRNIVRRDGLIQADCEVFYAFLNGRSAIWHQQDCKRGIYRYEYSGSNAQILSWGKDPKWNERFWIRFVSWLPKNTVLVVVDYHV